MYQLWGDQMLTYTVKKHTLHVGKVCRLCEEFAVYVCYRESLYHLQLNPIRHSSFLSASKISLFLEATRKWFFSLHM